MSNLVLCLKSEDVGTFIVCRKNSKVSDFARNNGIQYFELGFSGLRITDALKLKAIIKDNNIDVVHAHSANAHTVAIIASVLGSNHTLVLSKRTDFPVKNNWFSKFKYNHPSIHRIVCVSNVVQDITRPAIDDPEKLVTVYDGISPARFECEKKDLKAELDLEPNTILVGNCSALADHKDYFTFVDTVKIFVHDERFHFVIMGDGPLETEIRAYATRSGVDHKLSFLGFRSDIASILPALDVFLMTSKEEGLGSSLLDAMYNRVPIVSTRAGGIPEIVLHGNTGLLCDIGDAEDLSAQVRHIVDIRDQITENAYAMVVRDFTDQSMTNNTLKIYQECLSE